MLLHCCGVLVLLPAHHTKHVQHGLICCLTAHLTHTPARSCITAHYHYHHGPADALYNLGVAWGEQGQLDRAIFCYELAAEFNPHCAEAWNNLGVIFKEQDNLERAAECYMTALQIRPNFPQVRGTCDLNKLL